MRRFYSLKDELVKKSREAMLAAVQVYNNPNITFKSETYITLAIISWTYLLHAYYHSKKIDFRYFEMKGRKKEYKRTKYGAYRYWELDRCLQGKICPLDEGTKENLKFLIGIRNEIEHQMTSKIDQFISAKLQACAINFDYYIINLFGEKYKISDEVALTIQFSPLTPEQEKELINSDYLSTNIKNFLCEYEKELSPETINNSRYAYRVLFVPILARKEGQADSVVNFVKSDSEMAEEINRCYLKETEKPKYLPKQIVKKMNELGYNKFTITTHTNLWKSMNAKKDSRYGTMIVNQWYWYQSWVEIVENYCIKHKKELIK